MITRQWVHWLVLLGLAWQFTWSWLDVWLTGLCWLDKNDFSWGYWLSSMYFIFQPDSLGKFSWQLHGSNTQAWTWHIVCSTTLNWPRSRFKGWGNYGSSHEEVESKMNSKNSLNSPPLLYLLLLFYF